MKKLLFGLLLVGSIGFSQEKGKHSKDYVCEKGSLKIQYRISYKDKDGVSPCKVYELYAGKKTKKIGQSDRTAEVCEDIINRVLTKLESQGMTCLGLVDKE